MSPESKSTQQQTGRCQSAKCNSRLNHVLMESATVSSPAIIPNRQPPIKYLQPIQNWMRLNTFFTLDISYFLLEMKSFWRNIFVHKPICLSLLTLYNPYVAHRYHCEVSCVIAGTWSMSVIKSCLRASVTWPTALRLKSQEIPKYANVFIMLLQEILFLILLGMWLLSHTRIEFKTLSYPIMFIVLVHKNNKTHSACHSYMT